MEKLKDAWPTPIEVAHLAMRGLTDKTNADGRVHVPAARVNEIAEGVLQAAIYDAQREGAYARLRREYEGLLAELHRTRVASDTAHGDLDVLRRRARWYPWLGGIAGAVIAVWAFSLAGAF